MFGRDFGIQDFVKQFVNFRFGAGWSQNVLLSIFNEEVSELNIVDTVVTLLVNLSEKFNDCFVTLNVDLVTSRLDQFLFNQWDDGL